MREVIPRRLYLGNALEARDLRWLYEHEFSAVVDLAANEAPAALGREMLYCRFPMIDGERNSDNVIEAAIRCVSVLVERDFCTLLSCTAGMSRSPAIAAVVLASQQDKSPDECLSAIARDGPHDLAPRLWMDVKAVYERMVRRAGRL